MIAGGQHFGDGHSLKLGRPRVMGVLQKPGLEAFGIRAFHVAHDARDQPDDGVEHGDRTDLAAGEDVITDGDLFEVPRIDHPLVDAFKAAANDHGARAVRQLRAPVSA